MAIVEINWRDLSEEALSGLIEDFVTRDGTDYGAQEISTASKSASLREKIKSGLVLIFFDEASETCELVYKQDKHLYV